MRKVCLRVDRQFGERLRQLLIEKDLLDRDFPITSEKDTLFIPLRTRPKKEHLLEFEETVGMLALIEKDLEPHPRKPTDLPSALQGKIAAKDLQKLPHAFDIIGTIAIVELSSDLQPYEKLIGKAILEINPHVSTIYVKVGGVEGPFRLRPLRLIAGAAKTQTIHTEYGVRLAVDVMLTYFSPRLSTEHDRVANLISADEIIMDLFTGVGPFAILCAKRQKVQVYAIDINDQAIRCLEKSLTLNRLQGKVIPIIGDARQIIFDQLQHKADRIIMNLPHDAFAFLDVAVTALKHTGGFIHYYGITTAEKPIESLCATVINQLKELGAKVQVVNTRVVRPAAPHEDMVVLDLHVEPTDTRTAT